MLMVVAPLEQELAGLRRALRWPKRNVWSRDFWHPEGAPLPMELHVVGVGQAVSGQVKARLEGWKPWPYTGGDRLDGLLLLGFAGSLAPFLSAGDLVLPARYYGDGQGDILQPDPEMFRVAVAAVEKTGQTYFHLDSLTVDHLVSTPQEKEVLRQRYPVGTVNMEDYWIAAAARDAGVPFLAARAVLDLSTQRLPSYLTELPPSRAGAALSLVSRPWRMLPALSLARQASVASAALTRFALAFSREWSTVEHVRSSGSIRQ